MDGSGSSAALQYLNRSSPSSPAVGRHGRHAHLAGILRPRLLRPPFNPLPIQIEREFKPELIYAVLENYDSPRK
jgi:hypothetical protein